MGTMSKKTNSSKGKGKTPAIAKAESKVVQSRGLSKPPPAAKSTDKASIKDLKAAIPAPAPTPALPKRKLGLRGAAPWAARHAAKHAAEARARAAEPPPPGSARATIRVPPEAEQIKAKITELYNQTQKIRMLRKRLDRGFFEIGEILSDIQQ